METVQASVTTKLLAETNRARVLKLLYSEKQLTRRAIGDTLNLSPPTVAKIIDRLIEEGLIEDGEMLQSSGGRKPRTLSFVPTSHYAIGVDVSLHRIRMVMVDLWGSIQTARNYSLEFCCDNDYLQKITAIIRHFIQKSRIQEEKLLGIAISICGIIRYNSLTVEYSSTLNVREWDLSPLRDSLNMPLILINNAYAAGFMESHNNTRMNKMFYILITEGISGAYLLNNELLTGYNNRAGAIGHMLIPGKYSDKSRNTLEDLCSITALTDAFGETLDGFFSSLQKNEPHHVEFWNNYLYNLAMGINNIRSIVDVAIVIGGPLIPYLEEYLDNLIELTEHFSPLDEKAIYIRLAFSRSDTASVGAALQFVNRFLDF